MTVFHAEAAQRPFSFQQAAQDHGTQIERVHGYQLACFTGLVVHHYLIVLLHLGVNDLRFHSLLNERVPQRVNEGGEVRQRKIHGAKGCICVQRGQHAGDIMGGTVSFLYQITVLLQSISQHIGIYRFFRIAGRYLNKHFVLEGNLTESQLAGSGRTGE